MNTTPTPASASVTPRSDTQRLIGFDPDNELPVSVSFARQLERELTAAQTENASLKTQLGAWHALFETSQLTHAVAARDALIAENARLTKERDGAIAREDAANARWDKWCADRLLSHELAAYHVEILRLRALLAEAQKDGAHAEQLQKIVNDLVCAGWYNVHIGGLAHRTTINSETLDRLRALYRPAAMSAMSATPQLPAKGGAS